MRFQSKQEGEGNFAKNNQGREIERSRDKR
jgi:hypothetical protein